MRPIVVDTPTERQLQFTKDVLQSRMRLDRPFDLIAPYTRQMMSFMLFEPDPSHVLMIGLGGGSMPKFCHRHLPDTRVTVVEIDARVIDLRHTFQIPPDDDRLRIVHDDGVRFVAQLRETVDAIVVDAFDENGVAPELAESNFFNYAARRLSPTGSLVMNLLGKPHTYALHVERARQAFRDRILLAPVPGNDNTLLIAYGSNAIRPDAIELSLRASYLQSRLKLHFESYLDCMREGYAQQGLARR